MSISAISSIVTASTTLVVLLGASGWPYSADLEGSGAFVCAKLGFKKYLCDSEGFGLPKENLLDLFDKDTSSSDQLEELRAFLKKRGATARDILIYFVGHGGFAGSSQEFCLLTRRADTSTLKTTGLRIDELAEVLQKEVCSIRRYLVLDCCFAGAAYRFFQGTRDTTVTKKTGAAFRRFPTHGSALLYSSDQDTPSLRFYDGSNTAFSYALVKALENGDPDDSRPLSFRDLTRLIQDQLDMLQQEKRIEGVPFPAVISLDQSGGADIADVPFFPNPSIPRNEILLNEKEQPESARNEESADKGKYLSLSPTKVMIRGMRLLICTGVLILYWLTIGYMTPSLFPEKLLKISGSTYLTMLLLGNDVKTQKLKLAIIFCSLTIDWLLAGIILSHVLNKSLFPLPYVLIAWICGLLLIAILLFLIRLNTYYHEKKFVYRNVINIRKIQGIVLATSLLILVSQVQPFGVSFLYFPIVASVFSLGFFFYDLLELGGASYIDELTDLNPKGHERLKSQQKNTTRNKIYFDGIKKRKNIEKRIWYLLFVE